jgi:two-component system sensor histidine kinase KdpD
MITTNRPDPDSLLNLINQDTEINKRGKLKIFFGASAGVGKTYAMLSEAKQLKAEGIDVVIGIIETHGRSETEKLVEGFEKITLHKTNYKGVEITEFDLEAAIKRKPTLILVDELAHTNAPNSTHPKRFQDVIELIDNGINVYSTLNVQHLESVNDIVTKITGIEVKETIPDAIFDRANEIELIDTPSDELLKRLHQGKVYIADGASKKAAENFFKKSNLIGLREIALRRTAERVDAQMDLINAAAGKNEAQIGEKILVCVGHDDFSTEIIRHAKRMANRSKAQLIALYIETSRHYRLTDKAKVNVERNMRFAERIGAKIINISGNNAADEIIAYANKNGVTRVVIGCRGKSKSLSPFRSTLSQELIVKSTGLEITTITQSIHRKRKSLNLIPKTFDKSSYYLYSSFFVAAITLICLPFRGEIDGNDFSMFYVVAVVMSAAKYGIGASIFASILSVIAFNFFLTEPYHTLSVNDPIYYYTFIIMVITGVTIGSMASKLAVQARQSRKREEETSELYMLSKELSKTRGLENIAKISLENINKIFDVTSIILTLNEDDQIIIHSELELQLDLKEESVVRWVFNNQRIAGKNTDTLPSAKGIYMPLIAEDMINGVLCIIPKDATQNITISQIGRFETFASIIASSFARAKKAEQAENSKIALESEKLRSLLLSSVSHDLRTPLASISGAASSLIMMQNRMTKSAEELLKSIHDQTARLSRLITNLLDVTNLESGNIKLNKQPYFIDELIGTSLIRVQEIKNNRYINVLIEPDLPLIEVDGLLIEQVITNLMENAIRFTNPDDGYIEIEASRNNNVIIFSIADNGVGIPKNDEEKIFEKFYTNSNGTKNTGLGLTICKGIISTHQGKIWAESSPDGGAKINFTLPILEIDNIIAENEYSQ